MVSPFLIFCLILLASFFTPRWIAPVFAKTALGLLCNGILVLVSAVLTGFAAYILLGEAEPTDAAIATARSIVGWLPITFWGASRLPKRWTETDWARVPYTWAGLGLWTNYNEGRARLSSTGDNDADFKRRGEAERAPWGGFHE